MTSSRRTPATAARYPYFDHDGPVGFAHRGGATDPDELVFENSFRAFEAAVDLGYRYLETDVHVTRDGVLVAFHDETLDRTTTGSGRIGELGYGQVRRALIAGSEPIPTMAELLAAWPWVRWNIDVKTEAAIAPLASLLRESGALDRVCVASFSESRLRTARALLGPRVATGTGPVGIAVLKFVPGRWVRRRLLPTGAPCVQVPLLVPLRGPLSRPLRWLVHRLRPAGGLPLVTPRFVRRAHEHGVVVHVWTIDDASTMHELLDVGADGIISDRIDILRDVLSARGQWPAGPAGPA